MQGLIANCNWPLLILPRRAFHLGTHLVWWQPVRKIDAVHTGFGRDFSRLPPPNWLPQLGHFSFGFWFRGFLPPSSPRFDRLTRLASVPTVCPAVQTGAPMAVCRFPLPGRANLRPRILSRRDFFSCKSFRRPPDTGRPPHSVKRESTRSAESIRDATGKSDARCFHQVER